MAPDRTGSHELAESPHLPVAAVLHELDAALGDGGVAVLAAPPGTGKTTAVPPALCGTPWLAGRRIVVLEPRRLAARAAAARMAGQHGEPVGGRFGYTVRHDRRAGPHTRVEVVTEGVLVRRLQSDPALEEVGLVILDEFHERSLEADLALALLLDVRGGLREDLRLLVMSATLDTTAVASLLGGDGPPAAVVEVGTPSHPVALRWRPGDRRRPLEGRVGEAVLEALGGDRGDVLVFLPGRAEIARTARWLDGRTTDGVEVLELHGSVPDERQDLILAGRTGGARRVVLATSIAETSITVPGVGVVVDAGRRRTTAVDPRSGLPALVTVPVSQAGADQRAGRAGREGPGVCYRLWAEGEHRHRPRHDPPEITRADLSTLVLQTAAWGVADPADLPWLDPPPAAAADRATALLADLGALDGARRLTPLGRRMARLGTTPRLAAMVMAGAGEHAPPPGADAAAALQVALEVAAVVDAGGPGEVDLAERVRSLRAGRAAPDVRRLLRQLRSRLPPGTVAVEAAAATDLPDGELDRLVGRVALAGFADRLARRRDGPRRAVPGPRRDVFQLRHGGEVALEAGTALAGREWLVVVDLDAATGAGRPGSVRMAAALHPDDARTVVEARAVEVRTVEWGPAGDRVAARTTRLDAISVGSRPWRDPDPGTVTAALHRALERDGPALLPRWAEADQLRARVAFAAAHDLPAPSGRWPDLSEEHLRETAAAWLLPGLAGVRDPSELAAVDVRALLGALLGRPALQALDAEAPTHWVAPDGGRHPLRYGGRDGDPATVVMSVRLQRLLGVDVHPSVSRRTVPVVVELLSPADRPVQRTTDLPGFWRGSYAQVRAELRGRYRRHEWPGHPV